jgi:murein DD-endopeptidase MepM/ murein hydrolase activator NlpD
MLRALSELLAAVGKLFVGIFVRSKQTPGAQSQPIEPEAPPPTVVPPPLPGLPPLVVPPPPPIESVPPPDVIPAQAYWWNGAYPITQAYGCTDYAAEGPNPNHPECPYFHEGVDFGMPCMTAIRSAGSFTVMAIDPPGYGPPGNSAALLLRGQFQDVWLYHMAQYAVTVGQKVNRGDLLGWSGTRGYSTGCHLHFEVRPRGGAYRSSIDPWAYIHEQF